ncbi:HU family DNA-binding protein, partial [Parabacteroides sp. OttesenSCG-928-O15]|nr:HU family DNA-binding protein [Parabacteroides sp. OttesenSCG-928-O15]
MKNKELVIELSKRLEWTQQEVADMMSALSTVVGDSLVGGDSIYFQGFGQFEV